MSAKPFDVTSRQRADAVAYGDILRSRVVTFESLDKKMAGGSDVAEVGRDGLDQLVVGMLGGGRRGG